MDRDVQIEHIAISALGKTWGPRPTTRMVDHVKRHGVLVPVLAARMPDDDGVLAYRIIDGNRRVRAAHEARLTTVPAIVFQDLADKDIAELTIAANTLRTSNPVTEWWAIADLFTEGYDERDLNRRTGITTTAIKSRVRLGELDPRVFAGLVYGKIAPSVAEKVARLPVSGQDRLGELYDTKGRLLSHQVEAEAASLRQPRIAHQSPPPDSFPPETSKSSKELEEFEASDWEASPITTDVRPIDRSHPIVSSASDSESTPRSWDLHPRLSALAQEAITAGIDDHAWIEAAARAYRHALGSGTDLK